MPQTIAIRSTTGSCARCKAVNSLENSTCSQCGAPLQWSAAAPNLQRLAPTGPSLREKRDARRDRLTGIRQRIEAARQLYREGDVQKACAAFINLLQVPMPPEEQIAVYSCLGAIYGRQGQGRDSVAAFYAATRIGKPAAGAYFNLGMACRQNQLWREALECFQTALQLEPNHANSRQAVLKTAGEREAHVQQLTGEMAALKSAGDLPGIKALCQRILSIDPHHAAAARFLGALLERDGNLIAAARLAARMAKYYPADEKIQEWSQRLRASARKRGDDERTEEEELR